MAARESVPTAIHELAHIATQREIDPASVTAWLEKWNFRSDRWLARYVDRTVKRWHHVRGITNQQLLASWGVFSAAYWAPEPKLFRWDPTAETEQECRFRFESYIQDVKQLTPNTERAPTKRDKDHFNWLALRHIGAKSDNEIAEIYQTEDRGLDAATVGKRVRELAAICRITLR